MAIEKKSVLGKSAKKPSTVPPSPNAKSTRLTKRASMGMKSLVVRKAGGQQTE